MCDMTRSYVWHDSFVCVTWLIHVHPKPLIEMWITCLDPVSANSEKNRGSELAVRVGQRLQSRFGQNGAVAEQSEN